MSSSIRIETVENGFVACKDDGPFNREMGIGPSGRFAFETFESLTAWLDRNLNKPKQPEAAEGRSP